MADVVLRTIAPRERDAVLDLLAGWLNDRAFFARYFAHDPSFRDDLCFVAELDGRMISTLQVFRKAVRVDGAVLDVACVGNVYTDPTCRAGGTASALLERALAAMEPHGFDASLLFASRLDFYARFGWRSLTRQLSFISGGTTSAPATPPETFDVARDLESVMAVYDAYGRGVPGATARDAAYWNGQLRYAGNPDERFLVARRAGQVIAYARGTTLYDFPVITEHGCAAGEAAALADLIVHLHRDATGYPGSLAQLAPDAALAAALAERGLAVRGIDDGLWMWHPLSGERLAAALRLPVATVRAEGFFAELLPAGRSRYWMSDRF